MSSCPSFLLSNVIHFQRKQCPWKSAKQCLGILTGVFREQLGRLSIGVGSWQALFPFVEFVYACVCVGGGGWYGFLFLFFSVQGDIPLPHNTLFLKCFLILCYNTRLSGGTELFYPTISTTGARNSASILLKQSQH